MLEFLRNIPEGKKVKVTVEFRRDIRWWQKFLPGFEGECILWMCQIKEPDAVAASDSSLEGMGAVCGNQYIKLEFPERLKGDNITHLELLAIVMVKVWRSKFEGRAVIFKCDNEAVVTVVNTGRARDQVLVEYLRELAFLVAGKFEFRAVHLPGQKNILPDLLSRWGEGPRIRNRFLNLTKDKGFTEICCAHDVFCITHTW